MDSMEKKEHKKKRKSSYSQRKPELLVKNEKMTSDFEVEQKYENSKKEIDEIHNQEFDTVPHFLNITYIEEDEKEGLYSKANRELDRRVPKSIGEFALKNMCKHAVLRALC